MQRRKAQIRRQLVDAGRALIADDRAADASIQEITERADVGFGSFYNHFESKTELFDTAMADVLEELGTIIDEVRKDIEDPAEAFTASLRQTARLGPTHPQLLRIIDRHGLSAMDSEHGLAPRARRDIAAAVEAGRFHVANQPLAFVSAAGSLLGLLHLSLVHPELVDDDACDTLAEQLLLMFGMDAAEAHELAWKPIDFIDRVAALNQPPSHR
jgi:AcrR family transcriptional regulator